MNTFSIEESIKYGWEKLKGEKAIWVATLALFVLFALSSMNDKHGSNIIGFIASIVSIVAQIGYYKLLLRIHDGEKFEWPKALEIMFNTHKVFWKYLGASILSGILTLIGFVLLIIPGFFVISALLFAGLLVIDTGLGPVAALKESREITKGNTLKILGFILVIALMNIAGFIALGIGILISMPVSMLAMVHVYRKLLAAKASPAPVTPNPVV